ncbi:MAG: type II toxin-antitoxin system RelE/ParE family toxin [Desulfarculaceae bacterium]|nr:type II toxin-antitoxin system RelE/ParE family toxin [Desulfarculaceae bacterium]
MVIKNDNLLGRWRLNAANSTKGIGLTETNKKWEITFFNKKVYKETYNFPPGILANLLHIINLIEEFGPNLGKPHTKSMSGQRGLFEITASGEEGAGRSFFCYIKKKEKSG